jgi:peptidoglycan lytic transglycosylase
MKKLVIGCAVAALVALSPRTEARPSGSVKLATQVVPLATQEVESELGLASWYGEEFQGNPTASGEIFDMNGLTAAHRSLPLGTKLKVTNLENNRSLIVRVNDRGPFIHSRFLDLSMAAAKKLGFFRAGLAEVRAEVVSYPKSYSNN